MILIGQYDSPFVRRVGIALTLYGIGFEHRPWSSFADRDKIATFNPLHRVPTLVLDDGDVLVDSHAMLDHLDHVVGPERAMFPVTEPARRRALAVAGLATGIGDKAVALFYERRLHGEPSAVWIDRCRGQILGGLAVLERERAGQSTAYWFGENIGHADIAVACVLRFLGEVHPDLNVPADFPALSAFAARLEALPAFARIAQPFVPPA